jgi:hypothetical protein
MSYLIGMRSITGKKLQKPIHNIIGLIIPFSFVGGITNNLFEIAPLAIFLIFGIWKKISLYFSLFTIGFLSLFILVKIEFGSISPQILARISFYFLTYIVFILYSYNLQRAQIERIFFISSGIMFVSLILARLSPDFQSFFYLLSRSYGDAEAVLAYSGGVSGLASEPSYAAGFLATILIGTLALRKQNWTSINYITSATLLFTVLGIILTASITGILSLLVISIVFVNIYGKTFLAISFVILCMLMDNGVFLESGIRALERINQIFMEVSKDPGIILFEKTLTARNSVLLEFKNYPFSGGLVFGSERNIFTSGNFMIETLHIVLSPLDYILFSILLVGVFSRTKRAIVLLLGLQIIIIQPVMLCFGLLAFRNVIQPDNKHC